MKTTFERVAGRLVLVAASGLPLLSTAVVSAQDSAAEPAQPAATAPAPAPSEVQRQLDALYRKNGMQAPSLAPDAREREFEARMQLQEQREAVARQQAEAQRKTEAQRETVQPAGVENPAPASGFETAAEPTAVPNVPPIESQPGSETSAHRTSRVSTTVKPSARRTLLNSMPTRSDERQLDSPVDTQPEPQIEERVEAETASVPEIDEQPPVVASRPPRRGFVLFGRDRDDNRGSFLGRLFGRDKQPAPEALVPPNPNIGIEAPAESIAHEPVVAPLVVTPMPNNSTPAASDIARSTPAAPAAESEWTADAKPAIAPRNAEGPHDESSQFELPLVKAGEHAPAAKPMADDVGNPFPEISEKQADTDNPFADVALDEPQPTKEPIIEPKPIEPANVAVKPVPVPESKPRQLAASPTPTSTPDAHVDPRMQRIAERSGTTGLKGFCPVALRDDRRLVDADATWAIVHKGRTYHVASETALKKFESDPEKYAPVASGHDVILLTVEGRRVEGSLEHAVWYKDRLHLFSSQETLGRFVSSLHSAPFTDSTTRQASGTVSLPEPEKSTPVKATADSELAEPNLGLEADSADALDSKPESAVRPQGESTEKADSFEGGANPFEEDFANPFEDEKG